MSKFTHLKSPLTIRGKVYKNRLIAAPTLFVYSVFFLPEIVEMCIVWWRIGQKEVLQQYPQENCL